MDLFSHAVENYSIMSKYESFNVLKFSKTDNEKDIWWKTRNKEKLSLKCKILYTKNVARPYL